jgi:hypothetical protein
VRGQAQRDVGLYVNPPDQAIVLLVDKKSQIQALDGTQPGLPMKKGRAGTMTHDYKRHGVTTLFAALNVLDGKVIGQCMKHHRHQEFIRFLNVIDPFHYIWCPRLTAGMILLGVLRPGKGLWVCICVVEEAVDGIFEFLERAKHAALEALFGEFSQRSSRRSSARTLTSE